MPPTTRTYYRNYDSSDTTSIAYGGTASTFAYISDLGWTAPSGKRFKEWNIENDGTSTGYMPGEDTGESHEAVYTVYAIWEDIIPYLVTDEELVSVAEAIREKSGTSALLAWPDEYIETIEGIETGGGSMLDPIRFFDYDGALVASYSSVPSTLPSNPSHSGLVAQGWNYTLEQIQTQFEATGTCDIGQMYITESGDTEIDVSMPDGRLDPYLNLAPNGTVTIDWGDGSSTDTLTGTSLTSRKGIQHSYTAAGDYTITVHVVSGTVSLHGTSAYTLLYINATTNNNRVYSNCVRAVRIGASTNVGEYAFYSCYSLASVTIPSGVTSIGYNAFRECYSLTSVTIPNSVTSMGTYMFYSCYSLASVTIPSGVTSMGNSFFRNCYSLISVTIPSSVTSINSYAFQSCFSLASVTIPSGVTSMGSSLFYDCHSLASVTIPNSVTSMGSSLFYNCYSLASVTIPSGVTKMDNNMFIQCYSLISVTIPSSVTSIGVNVFMSCYGLSEVHFLSATPPTVSNGAWSNVPTDCKIYVPAGSLSAYTSAANYPSSSTYTYVEE